MQRSITMTLKDVYEEMRSAGIRCSMKVISDGIATGAYPFGRVVSTGETGRRTVEIFRVDFEAWLATKIPAAVPAYEAPIPLRRVM